MEIGLRACLGLKPIIILGFGGTAKAVPFHKAMPRMPSPG
jgi:hypothetical protein